MIRYCYRMKDLNFDLLMEVYAEALEENWKDLYSELDRAEGLLQARQDFYQYLHQVFFATKGAFYAIYLDNGTYMSAVRFEPYKDGLLLEAVETAPSHRKKGYAYTLLHEALLHLRACGYQKIYSHISKKNTASIRLHTTCGFVKIADSATYIDGDVSNRAFTFCRNL